MMTKVACVHCGARTGLTERRFYLGGTGYGWAIVCADAVGCSQRQEQIAFSDRLQAGLEASRERRRVLS